VASEGRTVLFVSHNMGAITQLCSTALLFRQGRLVAQGSAEAIVDQYLAKLLAPRASAELEHVVEREGNGQLRFVAAQLRTKTGEQTSLPIPSLIRSTPPSLTVTPRPSEGSGTCRKGKARSSAISQGCRSHKGDIASLLRQ
jgi:ABC-type glutathione transport system ATPase component